MQGEEEKREEITNVPEPAPDPTPESGPEPAQEPTPRAPEVEIPDISKSIRESRYNILEEKMQRPDPWPDPPTETPEEKQD